MERLGPVLVLLVMAGFLFWRDPRRLSIGIILLTAVTLAAMDTLAALIDHFSDPIDHSTDAFILLGVFAVVVLTTLVLAAYLIVNGVVMVWREGRRLAHLLSLLLGLAIVGYMGLAFVAVFLQWVVLALALVLVGLPVMYLTFVFTAFVLYGWLYGRLAPHLVRDAHAVIVLGAGLRGDRVTPLLASRLRRGVDVFRRGEARGQPVVIVPSGGQGPGETTSEAAAMASWLTTEGVPEADILPEDRSTTTDENIAYSLALLTRHGIARPYVVVTNSFHAFRAAMLMRRHGMPGQALGSATARYFVPSATIREFLAVLRDFRWVNGAILVLASVPLVVWIAAALLRL